MTAQKSVYHFKEGFRDGIPIGLGYLSVSFGFGIMAVKFGLPILGAVLISMTNLTSAGQVAGLDIIAAGGTLLEMALVQFVINLRYSLMGLSLTQKLDQSFTTPARMFTSFALTDEIFAVASMKEGTIGSRYFFGLMSSPYLGWALGTLIGSVAGQILPASVSAALGIAIYGMFVAIIVPPAKRNYGVLLVIIIAGALSICLKYIPLFSFISGGFSVIICAIIASVLAAWLFPLAYDDEEGDRDE